MRRRRWDAAALLLRFGSDPGIEQDPAAVFEGPGEEAATPTARLAAPTTALHVLAREPDAPEALVALLLESAIRREQGADGRRARGAARAAVDAPNRHGVTSVGIAAAVGNVAVLSLLLAEGPDLEAHGEVSSVFEIPATTTCHQRRPGCRVGSAL